MYALLDDIQLNERCFKPELNSGLMNEEKRNASLKTRELNKEDPDSIRGNGRRLDEIWIRCDLCQLF